MLETRYLCAWRELALGLPVAYINKLDFITVIGNTVSKIGV